MELLNSDVELDPERTLGILQRQVWSRGIPVIIVFEGMGAAGKGTLINELILNLDPRGFNVYTIKPPNEEERFRPFLWRFWMKTPENGRMAVFDRSWYRRVLDLRLDGKITKEDWKRSFEEINTFERQLTEGGAVIIKFFLKISQEEQKKRFLKLSESEATAWRVTKKDWNYHKKYSRYTKIADRIFEKSSTEWAPWYVIDSTDRKQARNHVFRVVIETLQRRIAQPEQSLISGPVSIAANDLPAPSLSSVDLSLSLDRKTYKKELKTSQARLHELEHRAYVERLPVVIVYEGWDAAGKGGNIRRLTAGLDPRGYDVIPYGAPTDVERRHHYLWRFWTKVPKAGHFAIFDRSWYGRVLVERVEGFSTEAEWRRAYTEINEMEKQWADFGVVLVKFWLHIDRDEQLRRFENRQQISYKQWKITEEDWRNREKWNLYVEAVEEMIQRTHTSWAPWTILEANDKCYARIKALQTVIRAVDDAMNNE